MSLHMNVLKKFVFIAALGLSMNAFGKDFKLAFLEHSKAPTFDLTDSSVAGSMTFYDFMRSALGDKMLKEAPNAKSGSTNEKVLAEGGGISVKLGENNYNVHINFPLRATGGRSYGWTAGQVGDWSDRMYLDNLSRLVTADDTDDLAAFYTVLIHTLGKSDPAGIDNLSAQAQRVAANFTAIYTAEEYRAMVPDPNLNWDDAILQVTLLGAFHGGQSTFAKYYVGEFSTQSREQASGVYNRGKPGPLFDQAQEKAAEMNDYWQFSANPDSKQSGINITRKDFLAMGIAITAYESNFKNKNLKKIQSIVGGDGKNVFSAIGTYFTTGKADVKDADQLAEAIAAFMVDIHDHAEDITGWLSKK